VAGDEELQDWNVLESRVYPVQVAGHIPWRPKVLEVWATSGSGSITSDQGDRKLVGLMKLDDSLPLDRVCRLDVCNVLTLGVVGQVTLSLHVRADHEVLSAQVQHSLQSWQRYPNSRGDAVSVSPSYLRGLPSAAGQSRSTSEAAAVLSSSNDPAVFLNHMVSESIIEGGQAEFAAQRGDKSEVDTPVDMLVPELPLAEVDGNESDRSGFIGEEGHSSPHAEMFTEDADTGDVAMISSEGDKMEAPIFDASEVVDLASSGATVSPFDDGVLHTIDIHIDGICGLFRPDDALGCQVRYTWPMIMPAPVEKDGSQDKEAGVGSLWWDTECAVLNGRSTHKFIGDVLVDENMTIYLIYGDQEVGSSANLMAFGTAVVGADTLNELVRRAGCRELLSLPIEFSSAELASEHPEAVINIVLTHRLEPALYRRSAAAGGSTIPVTLDSASSNGSVSGSQDDRTITIVDSIWRSAPSTVELRDPHISYLPPLDEDLLHANGFIGLRVTVQATVNIAAAPRESLLMFLSATCGRASSVVRTFLSFPVSIVIVSLLILIHPCSHTTAYRRARISVCIFRVRSRS
jgi:hypothetical protein